MTVLCPNGPGVAMVIDGHAAKAKASGDLRALINREAGSACGALPASVDPGGRDVAPGSAS
ncbi:hypothetical protein MPLB_110017 [Mesorhizobium sp. ORS 3324]|nr:hypothetical protein MPLB_110017 [Mesorhizobium sp. ORS 3324]